MNTTDMAFKHLWTGVFLDARLNVFCDEESPHIIHYRVVSYDLQITGTAEESSDTTITPREKMQGILDAIHEKYIESVMEARDHLISHHGHRIH